MTKQLHVGIFLFDGVDIIDFSGPYEVFSYVSYNYHDLINKFFKGTATEKDRPMITHTISETGNLITAHNGLKVQADFSIENTPPLDILVIPGAPGLSIGKVMENQIILEWIRQQHDKVKCLASVCSGSFVLGQAGLLNGKKATTHQLSCDRFQERFPQIQVQKGIRIVDEGRIVTSAGATSGINMALYLVERFMGKENAESLSNALEFINIGEIMRP